MVFFFASLMYGESSLGPLNIAGTSTRQDGDRICTTQDQAAKQTTANNCKRL
jgi:hypothetical protein